MSENSMNSGKRIMAGILMIVGSCAVAFGVCIVGMILLSFAGGTNGGANIPRAYELTMLLLWPIALAITAILPGLLLFGGMTWQWPLRIAIGGGALCVVWWIVGMGLMMSYGAKPVARNIQPDAPPPMTPQVEHTNQFSVSAEQAKDHGLPKVAFAVSWPDDVQRVGNDDANRTFYLHLQRLDDSGAIMEELQIRPAAGVGAEHDSASGLPHPVNVVFDPLVAQARSELENEFHIHVRHHSWDLLTTGRQLQADRKNTAGSGQPQAILQFILSPPTPRENGLLVTMRAFESSKVKNCLGFDDIGMPQEVLASFHWLERNE